MISDSMARAICNSKISVLQLVFFLILDIGVRVLLKTELFGFFSSMKELAIASLKLPLSTE